MTPARIAFPGAQGWAAHTPGGRGGKILRVTTLAAQGEGSLAEALKTKGPRIVVFEVGGVIDLGVRTLKVKEPFLTIAGQTAPQPGITLIRGGLDIATHDVVVQHLRVRPGEAGLPKMSGTDFDAITLSGGAHDVIVDHCSLTWATDENLSASGPRFGGDTPEQWREATSHRITFSNNLLAEGLANATHAKGEHSKGSLIHDNARDILIVGNLYAHNNERNPMFKGGTQGVVVNNLIYDPGQRAIHYNLVAAEWLGHPYQDGRLALVGNVMRAGPSTRRPMRCSSCSAARARWTFTCTTTSPWTGSASRCRCRAATAPPRSGVRMAETAAGDAVRCRADAGVGGAGRTSSRTSARGRGIATTSTGASSRHHRGTRQDHRQRAGSRRLSEACGDAPGLRAGGLEPRHDGAAQAAAAPRAAEVAAAPHADREHA